MKRINSKLLDLLSVLGITFVMSALLTIGSCGPRKDAIDDPDVANVPLCVYHQDGTPVNLDELFGLVEDAGGGSPLIVSGDRLVEWNDPETGDTMTGIEWGPLVLHEVPSIGDHCVIVQDGAQDQDIEIRIITICSGPVVVNRRLEDKQDSDGNQLANRLDLQNVPDAYCGNGHVPDCAMLPDAWWGEVVDLELCCDIPAAGGQDVCDCPPPGQVVCDMGNICECLYIPPENPL